MSKDKSHRTGTETIDEHATSEERRIHEKAQEDASADAARADASRRVTHPDKRELSTHEKEQAARAAEAGQGALHNTQIIGRDRTRREIEADDLSGRRKVDDRGPPPGYVLTDEDLDKIAEIITAPQIDRLVRIRANIARRDEFAAKGIKPSTHVLMVRGTKVNINGSPQYLKGGAPVLISDLDGPTHAWLLEKGLAERPE